MIASSPDVPRIAFLISSLQVGGSERVMSILVNEIARRDGVMVDLIVYGSDKTVFYSIDQRVKIIQPGFEFDHSRRLRSTMRTLSFVRTTIKNGQYEGAMSFGERWNNFVLLACLGLGVRIFLSDRSSPMLPIGPVHEFLRRILYPRAAGMVAQTEEAQNSCVRRGLNKRLTVIPNPVLIRADSRQPNCQNVVLCVGRLIASKNHDRLIRIFAEIRQPDWSLVIVGDDSQRQLLRERLVAIAEEEGISDQVHFMGAQSNVAQYYESAKIFAFTSSSEGFPNVVAEALSLGLPVVAYDCSAGPSDLIRDGENGYLIDLYDDAEFRHALASLMLNEDLRQEMATRSPATVSHLTPEKVTSRYLKFMLSENS